MFANPVPQPLGWLSSTKANGLPEFGRWHSSRVRGAPEVLGQVPCSCLAEEIVTPGEGQIKALITVAGNPVISVPDSDRLDEALPMLDAMICIDNYLNETYATRPRDPARPVAARVSRTSTTCCGGSPPRSVGKWSDAGVPARPPTPTRSGRCSSASGRSWPASTTPTSTSPPSTTSWFSMLCYAKGLDPAKVLPLYDHGGPERMIDWSIRTGPFGDRYGEREGLTLQDFKDRPRRHRLRRRRSRASRRSCCTPDGKIHLAPDYIVADLTRLRARLDAPVDGMVLVSRRHLRSKNTWLHNVKVLVKGKERCTLMVHPHDAARLGIADGSVARVSSESGSLVAPVEVTDEMMDGVVSLPHGWGHDKPGTRLSVAREHAGVNNNILCPGRVRRRPLRQRRRQRHPRRGGALLMASLPTAWSQVESDLGAGS